MANLTFNSIQITGTKEAMQPILDVLLPIMEWDNKKPSEREESEFFENLSLFESLLPLPEDINWRDFYGTGANPTKKSDGYDYSIEDYTEDGDNRSIRLSVETAWVPCDGFCLGLSGKYNVSVTNLWNGDDVGMYVATNGEVVTDKWWTDRAEGIYNLNIDDLSFFFESEVIPQLEGGDFDDCSLEEFLEGYSFITNQEHIQEITDMFLQHYEDKEISLNKTMDKIRNNNF